MICRHLIIAGIGMLFLVISGCNQPASRNGQALLKQSHSQYEKQQYLQAIQSLTNFIEHEGTSREIAEAYYLRGLSYRELAVVETEDRQAKNRLAVKDLLETVKRTSQPSTRGLARVALGHIYFETQPDQPKLAIEQYRLALKDLKGNPVTDAVLYRLAVSLQKAGQWNEADTYLTRCFTDFPRSSFTPLARQRFGSKAWRLQWGALSDLNGAKILIDQLRTDGYQADWITQKEGDTILYKVQSGRYLTWTEAQSEFTRAQAKCANLLLVTSPK